MAQRGRKSSAALSVVAPVDIGRLPEPPPELTEYEATVWISVVATKPADWFQADTHKMLLAYCKHCSAAAVLDKSIDAFEPAWLTTDEGLDRYAKLLAAREKQTRAIISLSRSMRLTQQSKYDEKKAHTYSQKAGAKARPWAG